MAGEYLRRQARVPGATDDFHLGPLTVSASRTDNAAQLGEKLASAGAEAAGAVRACGPQRCGGCVGWDAGRVF